MGDEGNECKRINLKLFGQNRAFVQFKIKRRTPLRTLMTMYCERAGLRLQDVRFLFDGNPINETDTPASLDMVEGDTMEVHMHERLVDIVNNFVDII